MSHVLKFLLILICLLISKQSNSQIREYIYKPHDTESYGRITWLYNIMYRGDSLWVHGWTTSKYNPFSPITYIYSKLDRDLNLKKVHSNSIDSIYDCFIYGNFILNHRNNFVCVGLANTAEKRFFIEIDSMGNQKVIKYKSTLLPALIRYDYQNIIQCPLKNYLVIGLEANGVDKTTDADASNSTWFGLDSNGKELWKKPYPMLGWFQIPHSISTLMNKNHLISFTAFELDSCTNRKKHELHLMQINDTGKILKHQTFPHRRMTGCKTIHEFSNGDFLIGGNTMDTFWCAGYDTVKKEYYSEGRLLTGYLARIDTSMNLKWEYLGRKLGEVRYFTKLKDGNFIAVGDYADTLGSSGGIKGWMFKITATGVLLWEKSYQLIKISGGNRNTLESVCELSNGDLVAVGTIEEIVERDTSKYPQRSWLVKTNSQGDLITSSIPVIETKDLPKIFPNPFQQELNIDWSETRLDVKKVEMYDISGKIVYSIIFNTKTYKFLVQDFQLNGTYFLNLKDKNDKLLYATKIISEKK